MTNPTIIHMYTAREEIYPREASGRYARLRWICLLLTQLVFYGIPWLTWNHRQAVLFDLVARKFYLFGLILWPQDFIYLALLLIICAFSLFLFTAIAGRVWCGFSCPQTMYTELFFWLERRIEGTRSARMRLDRQPWSMEKLAKKIAKHMAWITLAAWTGFTFVAYFTPISNLSYAIVTMTLGPWATFWIVFYSLATYGNAGWLREQVCKYMCPYARFQSAMLDKDTLVITYDQRRGEPRTSWGERIKNKVSAGDCIDCSMCKQVCPTGIDIRNGLQYECIGCAACIDVCNSVMKKINAPPGLIRYSTESAITNQLTLAQLRQRLVRPRVVIYGVLLSLITLSFFTALTLRQPLKLDVIRDRGVMAREIEDGMIENVYRLQIMNTGETAHRYRIHVSGINSIALQTPSEVQLDGASSRTIPVRVRVNQGEGKVGANGIVFELTAVDDASLSVREKAVFFAPR